MKKVFLSVILGGIWITISEFVRNEFLLKNYWVNHYNSLGLSFETLPINGALWMAWSFILAYVIYKLLQKFSFKETIFLSWLAVFITMWISLYNLQVFPLIMLCFAIPLSLLEVSVAAIIIRKVNYKK